MDLRRAGIWSVLAVETLAALLFVQTFGEPQNIANVLRQAAVLGLVAVGQTFVVLAGLMDLSLGMVAGLVVVLACSLAGEDAGMAAVVGLALALIALGVLIGTINGALLVALRLHPLILTLGTMSILHGGILSYTDRSIGLAPPEFVWLANGALWGIPPAAILLGIVIGLSHGLLTRTRFGHHLMAAGGEPEAARRSGVSVDRVRLLAFMLAGACAALGGIVLAGRLGTGYPLAGAGLELDSIVAVVLGGTLLAGGQGSVLRTLGGVLALAVLSNALNLLAISAFVQTVIKGCVVVLALLAARTPREARA